MCSKSLKEGSGGEQESALDSGTEISMRADSREPERGCMYIESSTTQLFK